MWSILGARGQVADCDLGNGGKLITLFLLFMKEQGCMHQQNTVFFFLNYQQRLFFSPKIKSHITGNTEENSPNEQCETV